MRPIARAKLGFYPLPIAEAERIRRDDLLVISGRLGARRLGAGRLRPGEYRRQHNQRHDEPGPEANDAQGAVHDRLLHRKRLARCRPTEQRSCRADAVASRPPNRRG